MDVQHTYCRPGVSSWRTWYIKFVWRSLWISVKNHTPFISNRLIMRFCFRDWLRNQLPQTAGTKTGSRRKTEGNFNDHLGDLNRRAFWTNPLIYVCLQRKLDMSHLSDCEVILFGANELYSNPLSLSIYPIAHTYTQVHMRAQWSVTVNYKLGLQTSDFFFFFFTPAACTAPASSEPKNYNSKNIQEDLWVFKIHPEICDLRQLIHQIQRKKTNRAV